MKYLLSILCLFIFSCDDNSNNLDIRELYTNNEKIESLFKINNYFCFIDNNTKDILCPINDPSSFISGSDYSGAIEFSNVYYENISIQGNVIASGDTYIFENINFTEEFEIETVHNNNLLLDNVYEYQLKFTLLPTVMFYTSTEIVDEPKVSSKILINDNIGNNIYNLFSGIEIRGNTSQYFDKKSYDIELWKDELGEDTEKEELFNLRNDDDWILDAMYIDPSRSRNITAMQIWQNFLATAMYFPEEEEARLGQRGEYIELFINDEYLGIYSMNEQIDKKQLQLKSSGGLLYKAEDWTVETHFEGIQAEPTAANIWQGFELKHPNDDVTEADWETLKNLIDLTANSTDEIFSNSIEESLDIDNAICYFIFINLIQALDNTGKNQFIFRYDEDYPLAFAPWDLDITLGNYTALPWFEDDSINDIKTNPIFSRLYNLDVNGYRNKVKTTWNNLNQLNLYSELSSLFNTKINILTNSNAINRENDKWELDIDSNAELDAINNWILQRITILDDYINLNF